MADPAFHALSSAKKFGGVAEDYIYIHAWFDETKRAWADNRHRAIRHHSMGIQWAIETFGDAMGFMYRESDGHRVPVRYIGEQHVIEDCGFIPTIEDWLSKLPHEIWMSKGARKLSQEFKEDELPQSN